MLNKSQAFFLLWVTMLNQSQRSEIVIKNTLELMKRLDSIQNTNISEIIEIFTQPHSLHRYPKKMAHYVYKGFQVIEQEFQNDVRNIFIGEEDEVIQNLLKFSGIGNHKARIGARIYSVYLDEKISVKIEFFDDLRCNILGETIIDELYILNELEANL